MERSAGKKVGKFFFWRELDKAHRLVTGSAEYRKGTAKTEDMGREEGREGGPEGWGSLDEWGFCVCGIPHKALSTQT